VRVISGTAGGRRLVAPAGSTTRPTSDRVREATFNALGSLGAIDGATVLDLFAGSGALGIEALSRGAASATFVDVDRAARAAVEANLAACGLAAQAEVVASPGERFVADAVRAGRGWDLALLDPPYGFEGWTELLAELPADLVAAESGRDLAELADLAAMPAWEVARSKRYGRTWVTLLARR
jgi:16S rRNA (guanine966-N2)-methyltransferase